MAEAHAASALAGDSEGEYFQHDADIGVVGRGRTVEQAFESAARGTFAIMTRLAEVRERESVDVEFDEPDLELALVTWLNRLLALAHVRGLVLSRFALERSGTRWRGRANGEPWREGLERGTGVKGATLTMLSVRRIGEDWEARCIVDV